MTDDLEIISLKILKVLYHYHLQNPDSGLNDKALADRFDFLDQKKGLKLVQKALNELRDQFLLRRIDEGVHMINEKGIKHYERFKFIKDESENIDVPSNIVIQGDAHAIHNRYYSHVHHYHLQGESITFPGNVKEFMHHREDLLKTITEIEPLVMDAPKGEEALDKLEEMKTILNLDSSGIENGC